jgi:hypothetical protein
MNVWILLKGALVNGFYATQSFMLQHAERLSYLKLHGHAIRWVEYAPKDKYNIEHRERQQSAVDVAEHCPNLQTFDGADYHDDSVLSALSKGCHSLQQLRITGSSEVVCELAKRCAGLKRIELLSANVDEKCQGFSFSAPLRWVRLRTSCGNWQSAAEVLWA